MHVDWLRTYVVTWGWESWDAGPDDEAPATEHELAVAARDADEARRKFLAEHPRTVVLRITRFA